MRTLRRDGPGPRHDHRTPGSPRPGVGYRGGPPDRVGVTTATPSEHLADHREPGGRRSPHVSIVIVEDHALVREGLRLILEAEPGFEIVGEAADPASTFEVIEQRTPAVALVDLTLGAVDGIPFLRQLAVRFPA
ncbi:MAG: hypothetical protein C4343_00865, partial [Chloroflexota bacterium]